MDGEQSKSQANDAAPLAGALAPTATEFAAEDRLEINGLSTCIDTLRPDLLGRAVAEYPDRMTFERITVSPEQMGGVPCIRGLRIPVATVVGMVADGMPDDEILAAYPDLEAHWLSLDPPFSR